MSSATDATVSDLAPHAGAFVVDLDLDIEHVSRGEEVDAYVVAKVLGTKIEERRRGDDAELRAIRAALASFRDERGLGESSIERAIAAGRQVVIRARRGRFL